MLDKKTETLLKYIKQSTEGGKFKVFSVDDLQIFDEKIDHAVLSDMIKFLTDRSFLDMRYSDHESFALCVLSKGRLHDEEIETKNTEKKNYSKFVKLAFLGSLAGSLFGILLSFAIYLIFLR